MSAKTFAVSTAIRNGRDFNNIVNAKGFPEFFRREVSLMKRSHRLPSFAVHVKIYKKVLDYGKI
jgi:hypothetical protein